MGLHDLVAASCPVAQVVAVGIGQEGKHIGNHDTLGAGGAIVAAATEFGAQLRADSKALCLFLGGQRGSVREGGGILLQLLNGGHAGDRQRHILVRCQVAHGKVRILDGAAGQRLHGDEADVLLKGLLYEFFTLGLHDVVGEHDGLHPV